MRSRLQKVVVDMECSPRPTLGTHPSDALGGSLVCGWREEGDPRVTGIQSQTLIAC